MSVDHLARMRSRLITQFRGLPNLDAFFKALGDQLNDLEEFFGQLMTDLTLQNAAGAQLDRLGVTLGQGRGELDDSGYRTVLQAKIVEYQSNGTVEDVIAIMLTLAGAAQVQVIEDFPAAFQVTAAGINSPVSNADIVSSILQTKIAGVRATIEAAPTFPVFQLDRAATSENAGFDVGHLAGAFS